MLRFPEGGVFTRTGAGPLELDNTEVLPMMQQLQFRKCVSAFPFQLMIFCLLGMCFLQNILSFSHSHLLSVDFVECWRDKDKNSPCS